MEEYLIQQWNSVVPVDGTVYHLGDIVWTKDPEVVRKIINQLNGENIYLIPGNHDYWVKKYVDPKNEVRRIARLKILPPIHELHVQDPDAKKSRQIIILCHYPIETWNHVYKGSWHLHGHCHGNLKHFIPKRREIGVDCVKNLKPISYKDVKEKMKEIQIDDFIISSNGQLHLHVESKDETGIWATDNDGLENFIDNKELKDEWSIY